MNSVYYRSEKRNYWLDSSVVVMFLTLVCVFAFYKFGFYSAFFGLIATAAIIIFALHSRLLRARRGADRGTRGAVVAVL